MHSLSTVLRQQALSPDLIDLIEVLAGACSTISHCLRQGNLSGILGASAQSNIQGEIQQHLDIFSNNHLKNTLLQCTHIRGFASEEEALPHCGHVQGKYFILIDPLDGSSNIDVNVSVGTIFSVLPASHSDDPTEIKSYLKPGHQQLLGGYFLYGPSTLLVLTFGKGVYEFTLDPNTNTFLLSQDGFQIPKCTREFAINMSNQRFWNPPVQKYVSELLQGETGPIQKNFNMRWVASLVAEVHRILKRGGIFMYPSDKRNSIRTGKLRLMYECNPMSFIVEQAGGASYNGRSPITSIQPSELHERMPLFLGSQEEVDRILRYHQH